MKTAAHYDTLSVVFSLDAPKIKAYAYIVHTSLSKWLTA